MRRTLYCRPPRRLAMQIFVDKRCFAIYAIIVENFSRKSCLFTRSLDRKNNISERSGISTNFLRHLISSFVTKALYVAHIPITIYVLILRSRFTIRSFEDVEDVGSKNISCDESRECAEFRALVKMYEASKPSFRFA